MKKVTYVTLMTCVAAGLLGACSDELVPNGGTHNSELVGFTMDCSGDSVKSRSMDSKKPFCGVLAMTSEDNSGDSLYLHTNVMDNPVVVSTDSKKKAVSRGTPVNEANFGDNFYVYAYTNVDNTTRTYMQNIKVTKGTTAWLPESNFYWTENDLDFFAYHGDDQSKISSLNHNIVYSSNAEDMKKQASFSYTVPKSNDNTTDATVQPDIMMSFNSCGKSDYAGVAPLKFSHALSAVKFELHMPITGKIKTVTIEGIYGAGTCVYDGAKVLSTKDDTSDDYVWTTSGSTVSYTQSFDQAIDKADVEGDKTIKLDGDKEQFTFMLIPQTIPSTAKVKVVMWDSENNVEHTFAGTISDGTAKWLPGKTYTYIISRNAVVWEYVFEVTPNVNFLLIDDINKTYSVKSYKQTASAGEKIPLMWKATNFADYPQEVDRNGVATDKGDAVNSATAPDSWFASFESEGEGKGEGNVDNKKIEIKRPTLTSSYKGDEILQENEPKGSEKNPWDLSIHKHDGTERARCTANCYIVHSAGTYMLPLVYGNAIENGVANTKAYNYQYNGDYSDDANLKNNPETDYIVGNSSHKFHDHNSDINGSSGITQPYISTLDGGKYTVKDAVMLWQDAYNIVKQGSVELTTTADGKQALKFTLNREYMQQGNIVLAVRDESGTILWSWHIWVCDYNYHIYYKIKNYKNQVGTDNRTYKEDYRFTIGNLGHCMAKKIEVSARKTVVSFEQYDNDNNKTVVNKANMTVIQEGKNFDQARGNNVFYQWGRKDPLVGVQNDGLSIKEHYTDPDKTQYRYGVLSQQATIADGIKNPTKFFSANTKGSDPVRYDDWVKGPVTGYLNLWNNYHYAHNRSAYQYANSDGSLAINQNCDEYYEKIDNSNTKLIKTVYDPSPVGFKLPPAGAYRSISPFGKGTWMPIDDDLDVFTVASDYSSMTYTVISIETLYQSGDKSFGLEGTYTSEDIKDGKHVITNLNKSAYRFIWISDGGWKLRSSYDPSHANYCDYLNENKFNGGFETFTEHNIDTDRYYINTIGASYTGGTKMSIEATGQRTYGPKAYGTLENKGIANMGSNDVYLWTGDVVTTTNTHKNCNVAISLFIQQHDKYQSGFQSNSVFTAAKAMARPIRPMWDEDFSDGLR